MKQLINILIILVAGFSLCACDVKISKHSDVQKQVRVAVKTANLRTGPGTNHDILLTASGDKWQVKQGTVLDVVAEKNGWYEVRLEGDSTRIAYIKQSLCADLGAPTHKSNSQKGPRSNPPAAVPDASPSGSTSPATQDSPGYNITPSTPPSSEEVVEEVTTGTGSEEEVIF